MNQTILTQQRYYPKSYLDEREQAALNLVRNGYPRFFGTQSTYSFSKPRYVQRSSDNERSILAEIQQRYSNSQTIDPNGSYSSRSTSVKSEKSNSSPQGKIQTNENLKFECAVNALLQEIQENCPEFAFKFDKCRLMNGESIQRNLIRKEDLKTSNPDAEAWYNGNVVCIDAKNYSKSEISIREVKKLIGDIEVRKGRPGILVIQENSCLEENAYKECKKRKIIIVQLKKTWSKEEHPVYDTGYLTDENRKRLQNALEAQFTDVPKVDVLFTKNGYVDKRSKAWRNGQVTQEQLEKCGVAFQEGTGKVDEDCVAFKKYKKYRDGMQKKKKASNYDHEAAKKKYKELNPEKSKKAKKDNLEKEEEKISDVSNQKQANKGVKAQECQAEKERKHQEYLERQAAQEQIQAEKERKYQEYLKRQAEKERKHQEYLERKNAQEAEKERKHQEYLRRQAEKERKHQEYLKRQAEKERKHQEYLKRKNAQEAEKERKHQEYLRRQAEKERKHQEYLKRQAEKETKHKEYLERQEKRANYSSGSKSNYSSYGSISSSAAKSYSGSISFSSGYTYSNVSVNPTGPMKTNGTPDMRHIENRTVAHLNMNGTPDRRFKCNW